MAELQTYNGALVVQPCPTCGTMFGVERGLDNNLRLSHRTFYCPNGHGQSYTGKTEAEKLKDQLAAAQGREDQLRARLRDADVRVENATHRVRAMKGVVTRTKRRIGHGVCPCCSRTFQNVARHMKTKHPEYSETPA